MISKGEKIILKDFSFIKKQKYAGLCVKSIHLALHNLISEKASNISTKNLEQVAELYFKVYDCQPTFHNYKGFPGKICVSVNKVLVHGIPGDYILQEGDVVKVDVGATYDGAIADSAMTFVYGKLKDERIGKMLISCQKALDNSIKKIKDGNRVGAIGASIFSDSKNDGFGVISNYGGHGIDENKPHASPFVGNKESSNDGVFFQSGMTFAIEPMFVLGNNINTKIAPDGWSVITNTIGCHFEHSVSIDHNWNVHIITENLIDVSKTLRSI